MSVVNRSRLDNFGVKVRELRRSTLGTARAVAGGCAVLLTALAAAGCGAGAGPVAAPPAPSSAPVPAVGASSPKSSPTRPEPTDPPGLVPLTAPRAAAESQGDETEFVRQVRENLEQDEVETKLSDSRLLLFGRELCSVLSGGGLLADKVDYWAGFRNLEDGPDAAIVLAANGVFCRALTEDFTSLQLQENAASPTAAERGDLARFVTVLDEPDLGTRVGAIEDPDLERDAAKACALDFGSEWWESGEVARLESSLPEKARMAYVVGLVTAYCPDEADEMIEALEAFGDR